MTAPMRARRPRTGWFSIWKGAARSSRGRVLGGTRPIWGLDAPEATTPRRVSPNGGPDRSDRLEAPGEDGLLGVDAVLGLVEHHRARAVDHLLGHLLAAMG